MSVGDTRGTGWHRDLPDPRDYLLDHPAVKALLPQLGQPRWTTRRLPSSVDLREYLPAPENQRTLHSSTAFAVLALIAYFEARAHGRTLDGSRLFLHQLTLKLLGRAGSVSTDLRTTFKALRRFGTPPECYWPYDAEHAERDPSDGFLFSFQREYDAIQYVRIDAGRDGAETLRLVRALLAAGLPVAFGFSVPSFVAAEADIPFHPRFDSVRDGQAVLAVGYDDRRRIASTKGGLLFRCSWGNGWGEGGHGWLSYGFVTNGQAVDFWTVLRRDWIESGEFPDL